MKAQKVRHDQLVDYLKAGIAEELEQTILELQASNHDLREALLASDDLLRELPNSGGFYGLAIMENNQLVLSATPAESLQAFDDEVIEKAFTPTEKVIVAIENEVQIQLVASGINEVMHRLDGQYIFDAAIRALKEVK